MIRQIIALCAFLMLSGAASAGFISANSTGAFHTAGGASGWTGAAGTVSAGTAKTIESVNIGGKYIGVPTLGPIAAGAAELLIGMIQRSPTAIGIAVAPWLLTKGIEIVGDAFKVKTSDTPIPIQTDLQNAIAHFQVNGAGDFPTAQAACESVGSILWSSWDCREGQAITRTFTCAPGYVDSGNGNLTCRPVQTCPTDWTKVGNFCEPPPYRDPLESDWAKFRGETPPDVVLNELCAKLAAYGTSSVGCPVTKVQTSAITAALTDWSGDSQTGVVSRQVVKLTPAPSEDDPTRMAAELVTETKTSTTKTDPATGETKTEETTTEKPTENPDFCVLHPESMACAKLGEPGEAPELQKKDISVSLQPDSGFGPDNGSCPANRTYTTHNGGIPIVFSWAPVCQGATTFRPVVIGMAWLSAVLIFMGITKRSAS